MPRLRLIVKRLYALDNQRMVNAQATARIYVGENCIATEQISGLTESPVYKLIDYSGSLTGELRVEWQTEGFAEMTVTEQTDSADCSQSDDR